MMHERLQSTLHGKPLLLAVAADSEVKAVLTGLKSDAQPQPWTLTQATDHIDLITTGVGKANAAGAVARVLDPERHAAVLSVGIAGSYGTLLLRQVVAASASVYADEGVRTPDQFLDLCALGFPPASLPSMAFPADPGLLEAIRPEADAVGPIATVSTCSGTDDLALELSQRTAALAESMEGAAVAHVCNRLSVPFAELRVISNTCGDRAQQAWDIKGALEVLSAVIGRLCR